MEGKKTQGLGEIGWEELHELGSGSHPLGNPVS